MEVPRSPINRVDVAAIPVLYTVQHLTIRQIATLMGVSHSAVHKAIKKLGISSNEAELVDVTCSHCGKPFTLHRYIWKKRKLYFCEWACRAKYLENPDYNESRSGRSAARLVAARYFPLAPKNVVHHWDSNCEHNDPGNLAVFATHAEHMSFERGGSGRPIWDGRVCLFDSPIPS